MFSSKKSTKPESLYPEVVQSNPESTQQFPSNPASSSMYPSLDMRDLATNLFPDTENESIRVEIQGNPDAQNITALESSEELVIKIPGALVHLIDKEQSVEIARGEFTIVKLRQGDTVVAVLARVGNEIQWPLAKDEAAVKLDQSHYFFTLRVPMETETEGRRGTDYSENEAVLNYGLTIAGKGQEKLLRQLDEALEKYSAFRVEKVAEKGRAAEGWWGMARDVSPDEIKRDKKKEELVEKSSAAYWTTLAPNVEDYSSSVARMIAAGSGHVVKGILWCGDVTVDRLNWGNEFLKKRSGKSSVSEISPETLRRMKRVKRLTKMSEKMANGILSGVVKVSGFFASSVVNSKAGKKFFSLLPGEIVLASLDGFNKVCDAVEVAGKNVMSTSAVVTTELVSRRYGEEAGKVTNEGLDAAGHAIGTAWAVFKIRKALNPKSAVKPSTLAKAAAEAAAPKLKAKQTSTSK